MAPMSVTELLAPWEGAEVVPFADLATRAGVTREARRELIDAGLIQPVTEVKRGKTPLITKNDALMLATAALLALAAGLAVATLLRVLTATGAEVGSAGVNIPVPSGP